MYEPMSEIEKAEALEKGMVNLVELMTPNETEFVDYVMVNRPLVNASYQELEIAMNLAGKAEKDDPKDAEHWKQFGEMLHYRWRHLVNGGTTDAVTDDEVVAEMQRFETWWMEQTGTYAEIEREIEEDIERIANEMNISLRAATVAYNTGEAW